MDHGRSVRLDAKALAAARATGTLQALDPALWGQTIALRAAAPAAPATELPGGACMCCPAGCDCGDCAACGAEEVAVVSIDGPMLQRAESFLCGYADGYDAVEDRFEAALEHPATVAVVLRISSPGGVLAGLEEAVRKMCAARDACGKPVLAYVDEMAASAAYWLAACVATDGVYLPASGLVGSIGVMLVHTSEAGALEQEGIAQTVICAPAGKGEGHPSQALSDVARARFDELVASGASRFIDAVAAARGLAPDAVRALDAGVLEGPVAVAAGLANGVSSFDDVKALARARASAMRAARAAAEPAPPPPPSRPSAPMPTSALSPSTKGQASMSIPKSIATLIGVEPTASEADLEAAVTASAPLLTLGRSVLALSGAPSPAAAEGIVGAWKRSHETAESERAARAAEVAAAEKVERAELVGKLVVAGWETPATAWADPAAATDAAKREPAEPYASMPIAALRARVETLTKQPRPVVPAAAPAAPNALTAREQELCRKRGIDPAKYAETKSTIRRSAPTKET